MPTLPGEMYPDQSLYPADSVPAVVRRINNTLRRADEIHHAEGRRLDRLAEAHRGGRRGRLRRRAQRLRAHEADDRRGRRRRALRGPAVIGQEVRPHGRQGAGADPGGDQQAGRGAPGGGCVQRADRAGGAHRCGGRNAADRRRGRARPRLHRYRQGAHLGGLFHTCKAGLDQAIARGLAYAPYADLVWCETAKPDLAGGARVRRGPAPRSSRASSSPTTARRPSTGSASSTTRTIAKFQRELAAMGYRFQFITLAGFHALNYSMFELARGYKAHADERLRRPAAGGVRRRERTATRRPSTSARSGRATSMRSRRPWPAALPRSRPSPAAPRSSSSTRCPRRARRANAVG